MTLIDQLFTIMAPVLVCAGLGWLWAKRGGQFDVTQMTTLISNIGAPCLVFSTLSTLTIGTDAAGRMVVGTLILIAATGLVSAVLLRLVGLSLRAFLPAMTFPNTGNMGLPLSLLAFGELGLGLAVAVFCVYTVCHFTGGIAISSGSASLRTLARMPLLYAVPPALLFMLSDIEPPQWIAVTTEILGGLTIPLMLIALGVSLARLKVQSLPRSLALAALRLGGGFVIGLAVAWGLDLDGAARGVLIMQSTMPSAVFNYLFATQFHTEPENVAGVVVASTLMSFVALPFVLWFVL